MTCKSSMAGSGVYINTLHYYYYYVYTRVTLINKLIKNQ